MVTLVKQGLVSFLGKNEQLGVQTAPRETENNVYAKFWGDKQRAFWYVMVFSGMVNCDGYTDR